MEPRAVWVRRKLLLHCGRIISHVELIAAWEPQSPDDEQRHIQWAQNISQALAPYALKGGYISLLEEEQERVRLAFGSNYERLLDLKRNILMMCFDRRSDISHPFLTR